MTYESTAHAIKYNHLSHDVVSSGVDRKISTACTMSLPQVITVAIDTRHTMTGQVFLSPAAFLFSMFFSKIVKYFDKMILV